MDRTETIRDELNNLLHGGRGFSAKEAIDVVHRQLDSIARDISVSNGLVYRFLDSDDLQSEDLKMWMHRIANYKEDPSLVTKEFLHSANWVSINEYFDTAVEEASLKENDMAYWAISQRLGLYGGSPHQPRKVGHMTEYKLILERKSKRIDDNSLALKQIAQGLLAVECGKETEFSVACEAAATKLCSYDSMSSIPVGTILYKEQTIEISVIHCQIRIKVADSVRQIIDTFSLRSNHKAA